MNCQCNQLVYENRIGSIECTTTGKLVETDLAEVTCEEDLIEKIGVYPSEKFDPTIFETGDTWTQIFIPEILCIPHQKPDAEQVLKVTSRVQIISQRVVKTPIAETTGGILIENYEGTKLTGWKLVIEGILRQKVIYTAAVENQSVHSAHFDVPFSAFIILPTDDDATNPTSPIDRYKIEPFIEDIFVCRVSRRQIFKNVTIFIKASKVECI